MLVYSTIYMHFIFYSVPTYSFLGFLQLHIFFVWFVLMFTDPGSPTESVKDVINSIYHCISINVKPEPNDKELFEFFNKNRWIYLPSKGLLRGCRYCKICDHYKLPRMHHSSLTNKCVYRLDHHCLLVNNCVGYRNYNIFTQFTILTLIVSLL